MSYEVWSLLQTASTYLAFATLFSFYTANDYRSEKLRFFGMVVTHVLCAVLLFFIPQVSEKPNHIQYFFAPSGVTECTPENEAEMREIEVEACEYIRNL